MTRPAQIGISVTNPEPVGPYFDPEQTGYAEAIRTLRQTLLLHRSSGFSCVVALNAWPNEGKSITLLSLAASLGEIRIATLLVDGDTRRAGLSHLVDPSNRHYWGNFDFVSAEAFRDSQTNHLSEASVIEKLKTYRDHYKIVLIDSPPLTIGADGLVWTKHSDAAIFVTSRRRFQGLTEAKLIEDTWDIGKPILGGVIVNC